MADVLREKALTAITRERMLAAGDRVLVAFSGGADSAALLHVLWTLRASLGLDAVAALHVNHLLRGDEADRDETAVHRFCEQRGIPLVVRRIDVAALARERHAGVEEAGRAARYDALRACAAEQGYTRIATAHTRNDAMETLLFHLARGTGLGGLGGISPVNGDIVRPLIDCTRAEVEAYCAAEALPFVTDSTNAETAYARNRIRAEVIPALTQVNPRADEAFARLMRHAREDADYLDAQARALLADAQTAPGRYRADVLRAAHPALRSRALRLAAATDACEDGHVALLERLLEQGGAVTLPGGRIAERQGEQVCFADAAAALLPQSIPETPLSAGRDYEICERIYRAELVNLGEKEKCKNREKIHRNLLKTALDYDRIQGSLRIRGRLPGDSFHPAGRQGGKTLKKLFNEQHISPARRAAWPIVCDDAGIVLVSGLGCDRRVAPDEQTKQLFLFYEIPMAEVEIGGYS